MRSHPASINFLRGGEKACAACNCANIRPALIANKQQREMNDRFFTMRDFLIVPKVLLMTIPDAERRYSHLIRL
jgi:hypothetical protein